MPDVFRSAHLSPESEFEVTAFYRGRLVLQNCLFCLKGLRLVGPGPGAEAWTELDGTPLALPEPSSTLTDQRAVHYISRVLGSLGAGLALWCSQTELRAQRLGHCRAHWALGEQASPGTTGREVTKERDGQQVCYIPEFVNGEPGQGWAVLVRPGECPCPEHFPL